MTIAESFAEKFNMDGGRPSAVYFHLMLARMWHSHRGGGRIRFKDGSEIKFSDADIQRYGEAKTLQIEVTKEASRWA